VSFPVSDIFFSLQGEGHFVGYPMVFVRLAGCSVQDCHIRDKCDESPWKMRERLSKEEIIERVRGLSAFGIVCITGGEPTDHDILPLISALRDAGYRIHMETSGVRSVAGYPLEWLTVSPKLFGHGRTVQKTGHTLKIVVRPEWGAESWNIIKGYDADTDFFHRYLQPLTVGGVPVNLPQVVAMLLNQDGPVGMNGGGRWALSTQAHRHWGLK
jgi:organic radical activating enzyme